MLVVAAGDGAAGPASPSLAGASLNGRPLGALPSALALAVGPGVAFAARDVTEALLPRNVLRVPLALPPRGAGRGDLPETLVRVWLEIQSDAPDDGGTEAAGGSRSR